LLSYCVSSFIFAGNLRIEDPFAPTPLSVGSRSFTMPSATDPTEPQAPVSVRSTDRDGSVRFTASLHSLAAARELAYPLASSWRRRRELAESDSARALLVLAEVSVQTAIPDVGHGSDLLFRFTIFLIKKGPGNEFESDDSDRAP
jgi:hypothetical protein